MTLPTVFLILLATYVVFSVATNRHIEGDFPSGRARKAHILVQGPIFWCAAVIAWNEGAFTRELVSPFYIGLGLVAGHLIFGLSLLATHLDWRDSLKHFFDFGPIWNFTFDSPAVLTRFIGVAVAEELIYRAAGQTAAIQVLSTVLPEGWAIAIGIVVVALGFVMVHKHFFENTWHVSLEFVVFALVLGVLYHWTASFILVMVIHAMRDIEIAYLEYLIKVEELGDEAEASKAIEQAYSPGRLEQL